MIKINDLHFSYTNLPPYILDGININIEDGEYVSILGENGSAKSTLIKLILNILKPCSGIININTKSIGYVPQRAENFNTNFPITVYEVLSCHRKALKLKKSIIMESLKSVSMENYKNSLIGNLSGGQQQKVFIARALMGNPKLIILDEPSTGIDIKSQGEIYSILKKLNKHNKITIVSIEHNLKAALENSTHILTLKDSNSFYYSIDQYKKLLGEI